MRSKRRAGRGAKAVDLALLKAALSDGRMRSALGVVRKFAGEDSHFEIDTDGGGREVLVDVELMPNREKVLCRLGFGGDGIYRIPRVGSEVAILIPADPKSLQADDLDGDCIIVGVLDTDAPEQLDGDDIVVISSTRVHIVSADIKLGTSPGALDGVVVGSGIDPFTGSTYNVLGNASAKVSAEK